MNLDPFNIHNDASLWTALSKAHLQPYISTIPEGLDYLITEGGENLRLDRIIILFFKKNSWLVGGQSQNNIGVQGCHRVWCLKISITLPCLVNQLSIDFYCV